MRLKQAVTALGVIVLAGSALTGVAAQQPAAPPPGAPGGQRGGPPPAPPKNLQVLPKDMQAQQVMTIMRNITTALGVQCGYCHVFEGPGSPNNDFADDTKTPKLVARVMMQMTGEINQKLAANITKPADEITQVGCMTCHRGEAIPKVPPPAAAPARGAAPGAPGAPGTTTAPGTPPPQTTTPPGR